MFESVGETATTTYANLSFQRIVIIICLVVMVLILMGVAYMLYYSKSKIPWPPATASCPDYWLDSNDLPGQQCKPNLKRDNAGNITDAIDFTVAPYIGSGGACAKYQWATTNGNNIAWDGVTYGVANPCNS